MSSPYQYPRFSSHRRSFQLEKHHLPLEKVLRHHDRTDAAPPYHQLRAVFVFIAVAVLVEYDGDAVVIAEEKLAVAAAILEGCLDGHERLVRQYHPVLLGEAGLGMEHRPVMAEMCEKAAVIGQIESETGKNIAVGGFVLTAKVSTVEIVLVVKQFEGGYDDIPSCIG